jgi:hypothetical protein
MAADVLDFAGLEETAAAAATPAVDADVTAEEITENGAEVTTDEGKNPDGTEKTEEQKTAEAAAKEKANLPGSEKTPAEIRKVLKSIKDADPKNGPVVKQLHGAFERWEAAKQIFPKGVGEMKEAKAFMELVGGTEGYESLQQTVQAIEASDAKLYAGDPTLFDDILEDLKAEGKTEAFGKLAPAFLDKLKTTDEKAYYAAFAPHFLSGLDEVNIGGAIAGVLEALKVADDADPKALLDAITKAKGVAGGMDKWLKGLQEKAQKSKAAELDPERQKLAEDRKAFLKQQEDFKTNQTKEFQKGVAVELEKENNKSLGTALKSYLKMPFFKGFPRETLVDLGNGIKTRMYDTLKADKTYQAQMKALWGAKNPDSAKIKEYHNAKVSSIAEEIVRLTVQQRYPGYAKGGSAAGRVAAANAKNDATKKADAAAAATGKPVYVPQKPKWEAIDWDKDPKQLNYIAGRAYLKGSGKLVTWRR